MAEGQGVVYNNFKTQLFKKTVDMDSDTLKAVLVTAYIPDIDSHTVYADISGDEVSGGGYTAGGATLANPVVSQDDANNRGKFVGDNITWTNLNAGTPSHLILRDTTFDCLIAYWEITTASTGANYLVKWNADGITTSS